jgi:hypothetical protein
MLIDFSLERPVNSLLDAFWKSLGCFDASLKYFTASERSVGLCYIFIW